MLKKQIFILLYCMISVFVAGQSDIRFNNFWDNLYSLNPAAVNDAYELTASMGARKQWVNFPGAPVTFLASALTYFPAYNTQLGIKAVVDKIGYTTTSDIDLSYAYAAEIDRRTQLNLGISFSFQTLSYDISKINTEPIPVGDDPIIYSNLLNTTNLNSDLGLEFLYNYEWIFGAASHNLFSLFLDINEAHLNTNYVYMIYRQQQRHEYMTWGFGVSGIQYGNLFQAELSATTFFKEPDADNGFQLGLFYRTWREFGAVVGFDLGDFKISYSYDYNVGDIRRRSLGTHEIMLTYKFGKITECRVCWY